MAALNSNQTAVNNRSRNKKKALIIVSDFMLLFFCRRGMWLELGSAKLINWQKLDGLDKIYGRELNDCVAEGMKKSRDERHLSMIQKLLLRDWR
jgi:hypothetical protein